MQGARNGDGGEPKGALIGRTLTNRGLSGRGGNLANGQKHNHWHRSIAESAAGLIDRSEAQGRIECDRIGFGIHHNAYTTKAIPHFQSERQHRTQKQPADSMSLDAFVHGQSGKAQDGQRVSWKASTEAFRQRLRNHLPAGDGDKPQDAVILNGDVSCSNVVAKLILASVTLEESIEVDIATAKSASIVPGFQPPNANFELCITHETVLSGAQ